jgi:glycine cleavage system protein P-like pyridoxal-binding family
MQPVSGYSWKRISGTAIGTAVVSAEAVTLHSVVIGENKTGTIAFYDNATGSAAADYMVTLQNTAGTVPQNIVLDAQCKNGLSYVVSGTTDLLITYS